MEALRGISTAYAVIVIATILMVHPSNAFARRGKRAAEGGARQATQGTAETGRQVIRQNQTQARQRVQAAQADARSRIVARQETVRQNQAQARQRVQAAQADTSDRIAARQETIRQRQQQAWTGTRPETPRTGRHRPNALPTGVTRRSAPGTTIGFRNWRKPGDATNRRTGGARTVSARSGAGRAAVLNHNRWLHPRYGRQIYRHVVRPARLKRVYYFSGPRPVVRTLRPGYHRKYIFVSLGGWWPRHYNYTRYYWYGWHPYYWYGSYPVATRWGGDTYNYYTYNYNQEQPDGRSPLASGGLEAVDHTTFQDVRDRMVQQDAEDAEPSDVTDADHLFASGVDAFENGDYPAAAASFEEAAELEPEDVILPFAHVQALFAAEEYTQATAVLRDAVLRLDPEQEGLFFPRGLYPSDDILSGQIDRLIGQVEVYRLDADLRLLAGYQLMGAGREQEAREQLQEARLDILNAPAAEKLLLALEKLQDEVRIQPDRML